MDIYSRKAGFTMMELIMVIVVLAILATVAIHKWPGSTINLGAQAQALVGDIRHTQNLSMAKGDRYKLTKTSSNSYQISNLSGTTIVSTVTLGSGMSFGTIVGLPNNLIVFDGEGIPYVDTGIPGTPLASMASIALLADGNTKTISISPETGKVET